MGAGPGLKRAFDVAVAAIGLVAASPLLLGVAVAVRLESPGPSLHWSRRVGRGNRIFRMPKFRTMRTGTPDVATHLLEDPGRWITPLGRFLRRSSLDELPQLINVLRGDMSLVGPRPIVLDEAPRYDRWLKYYCAVRPGITGMWQVSGRNNLTYRRRVACDVLYARRQSTRMNLAILVMTIPAVLSQDGSS